MINAWDWVQRATDLISISPDQAGATPSQIELCRAISSAYYGLFHLLTTEGTKPFAAGGSRLSFQATRAFNHAGMRKVCDAYARFPSDPFQGILKDLNSLPPAPQLIGIARAFVFLQEGRHTADYDSSVMIEFENAAEHVRLCRSAFQDFEAVKTLPQTTVFLTALLLADRWACRG